MSRLVVAAKLNGTEQLYVRRHPSLDRSELISRWQQVNQIMREAMAEAAQAHARLEAAARYIFHAVGDAEYRAEGKERE